MALQCIIHAFAISKMLPGFFLTWGLGECMGDGTGDALPAASLKSFLAAANPLQK